VAIPAAAAAFTGGMFTDISTEVEYRHDIDMGTHLVLTDHLQHFNVVLKNMIL
jgi:hypothetical protein